MIRTDEDDEFDRIAMENNLKGQPYYWSAMEVVIYTKRKCPNCTTAKQLLRAKNINYVEMDIEAHPEVLKDLPVRQMPQIFINGQRVGGLAGLQEVLK